MIVGPYKLSSALGDTDPTPIAEADPLHLVDVRLDFVMAAIQSQIVSVFTSLRSRVPSTSTMLSWRTLFFILALLNLKALPFVWHLRLLRRFYSNLYTPADVKRALLKHQNESSVSATTHPIFQPVSIHTHAPLYEIDWNLHKSNSTYFSDLDESRTALVTRLIVPGRYSKDKTLENKGIKGRIAVLLGSVHCSFHKEIKPYVRYECRSRILTWDRKWLVIATFLIMPRKGKEEVLLASAISKYVVKKGRYTISPEHCLRNAGWLPPQPETGVEESGVLVPPSITETGPEGTPTGSAVPASSAAAAAEVKEKLQKVLSRDEDLEKGEGHGDPISAAAKTPSATSSGGWDWHRIEEERLRGLKLAEAWLALDGQLKDEYSYPTE